MTRPATHALPAVTAGRPAMVLGVFLFDASPADSHSDGEASDYQQHPPMPSPQTDGRRTGRGGSGYLIMCWMNAALPAS